MCIFQYMYWGGRDIAQGDEIDSLEAKESQLLQWFMVIWRSTVHKQIYSIFEALKFHGEKE